MKIGITGSNNTGKTTLAYALAAEMRENGIKADIAHESVRCCPLGTRENASVEAQIWIAGCQMMMEEELCASEDIILCDKTVIDTYCYGQWAFGKDPSVASRDKLAVLEDVARAWADTYDAMFYLPLSESIPHETWHTGIDHRKSLDRMIVDYLAAEKIAHVVLPADFDDRVRIVRQHLEVLAAVRD